MHPSYDSIYCFLPQILVKTVPIKQGHKLRVIWPITPGVHHYKEGPSRYLGHLIGHEGEGSLFYILKKLGGFFPFKNFIYHILFERSLFQLWGYIFGILYLQKVLVINILAGWATSLSAGESESTFEFSFFRVVIDLTDAGHGKLFLSFFFFW